MYVSSLFAKLGFLFSLEDFALVESIGLVVSGQFGTSDGAKSGEKVDGGEHRIIVDFSGGDFTRPAGDEGDVDASFEKGRFMSLAAGRDAFGGTNPPPCSGGGVVLELELGFTSGAGGAVVRAEDDEGVVGDF